MNIANMREIRLVESVELMEQGEPGHLKRTGKDIPSDCTIKIGPMLNMTLDDQSVKAHACEFIDMQGYVLYDELLPSNLAAVPQKPRGVSKRSPVVGVIVGGARKR